MAVLIKADVRKISNQVLYPGQMIIEDKETPYGQLVVTANSGQINCYENGLLLFSSGDEMNNEENVHYAVVQHDHPGNILLVSGGLSGAINEILKYKPQRVDYVELNPALLNLGKSSLAMFQKKGVFLHSGDARKLIRESLLKYDVVLILLPPPSTLQLNRLYTIEFIRELKSKMTAGAIVSFALPTISDYVSRTGEGLNAILWQTLKSSFKNILIIPGGRTYFIASDGNLSLDIPGLIEKRGIPTSYVNKYYLDTAQLKERADYVRTCIPAKAKINYDFRPALFFAQLEYWMSYFNQHYFFILAAGVLVFTLIIMNLDSLSLGLFTGGITAGSFQVILILSLQIFCGFVFRLTGIIIMLFMLGLALGSYSVTKWFSKRPFRRYLFVQFAISAFSILIPLVLVNISSDRIALWLVQLVIAGMTLILSSLIGAEYSLASFLSVKKLSGIAARNYSADLFGSALGAFAAPVFLFPLAGMMNTGLILALLNTTSAIFLFTRRRNFLSL
jgi:spermidine synthase